MDNNDGSVQEWQNIGSNRNPDSSGNGGYGGAVRLADYDGDGLDDYISVGPNGETLVYLNDGQSGNSWTWTEVGLARC